MKQISDPILHLSVVGGGDGTVDWVFIGLRETCDLVGRKVLYNVLKLNLIMFLKV